MKGYKSNETQLLYLFKDGREKWKERALLLLTATPAVLLIIGGSAIALVGKTVNR